MTTRLVTASTAVGTAAVPQFAGIRLSKTVSEGDAPEAHFIGLRGHWLCGSDVANNGGGGRDYVIAAQFDDVANTVQDMQYAAGHGGIWYASTTAAVSASAVIPLTTTTNLTVGMRVTGTGISGQPKILSVDSGTQVTLTTAQTLTSGRSLKFYDNVTIGYAITPPAKNTYRHQLGAADDEDGMGTVSFRVGATQTGHAQAVVDSNNVVQWAIDKDFYATPTRVRDSVAGTDLLQMHDNGLTKAYGWTFATGSIRFRYITGGVSLLQFDTDGTGYFYNRFKFLSTYQSQGYMVATLPPAGTAGRRAHVIDALAPTFLGALTGGGAVTCPAFDNGTAWVAA